MVSCPAIVSNPSVCYSAVLRYKQQILCRTGDLVLPLLTDQDALVGL